jgi:hypothetical protein
VRNTMKYILGSVVGTLLFGGISIAAPASWWPVPQGWRTESNLFPLVFAPTIAHQGLLELRFSPGFAQRDSAQYFTYAFVWALKEPDHLRLRKLASELKVYYDGLVTTYGNPEPSGPYTSSKVEIAFTGRDVCAVVDTFDPFFTHAALKLYLKIHEVRGIVVGHRTYLFLATPRPAAPEAREALTTIERVLKP